MTSTEVSWRSALAWPVLPGCCAQQLWLRVCTAAGAGVGAPRWVRHAAVAAVA
jgi:hypothetical protein